MSEVGPMRTFDDVPWVDRVLVARRLAHVIEATGMFKTATAVADWLEQMQQPTDDQRTGLHLVRDNDQEGQVVGRNFPDARTLPLRAEAIAQGHPELTCQLCGGPNLLGWSAPNQVWNVGVPGREGILCPQCFALAYETATGSEPCWDLRPHSATEEPA